MTTRAYAGARWSMAAMLPVLLGMLLLAACDEKSSEPVQSPVDRIEVTASQITVRENATVQATARVRDIFGGELRPDVTWSSSDPEIATVDGRGVVTGVRGGVVRIIASAGNRTGSVGITVEEYVRSIELSPPIPEMGVATSVQLEATLRCGNGHIMKRPIQWSSADPSVLTVNAEGRVTAFSPGTTKVFASSEDVTVETLITVGEPVASVEITAVPAKLDVGQVVDLGVTLRDREGRLLNRLVTWTADGPAVTVDGTGRIVAQEEGAAFVTAHSEGVIGRALVTVIDPVTRIELEYPMLTMRLAEQVSVRAEAFGARGLQPQRTFTWSSADPSIATAEDGVIEARHPGVTTVTATSMGKSATMQVKVEKPIARLAFRWPAVDVRLGGYTSLVIDAFDEDGAVIHPRWQWSSSDPGVADVNEVGVVTGWRLGTVTITATAEGHTLTSQVRVFEPLEPFTVEIVPRHLDVMVGDTGTLHAIVRDRMGRVVDVDVTWKVLSPQYVQVDDEGHVRGLAVGNSEVTAEYRGYVSAAAEVIVKALPPVVHSVTISPMRYEMGVNQWMMMTAEVRDAEGGILNLPVTWGVSREGVVVISRHGKVESIGEGVVEVWAECHGIRARAEIIVRDYAKNE